MPRCGRSAPRARRGHAAALVLLAAAALLPPRGAAAQSAGGGAVAEVEPATVVWLVRHAERTDDTPGEGGMLARERDPELAPAGRSRAQELADLLADVPLGRVLSTDFRRTRATADPVAARRGLVVETYDPRNLEGLARRIRAAGGTWLVVGHSNTTPALAEALGGEPGEAIGEFEYDRLYQLVLPEGGPVVTTVLRFGG